MTMMFFSEQWPFEKGEKHLRDNDPDVLFGIVTIWNNDPLE